MTILKLKQSEGKSPRYFKCIEKIKDGSKVVLTKRLEEAKAFDSFQDASLTAQKPELNYSYEQVPFYEEACDVLKGL
jgi:hypothetical protein